MTVLNKHIFNTEKTDYQNPSLFLGQEPGLFDSINKKFPKIWSLFKKLRSQDWDEEEFDFKPCKIEFLKVKKEYREMMIRTLAWQWEADSIAARMLLPVMAPFLTSSELSSLYGRITDNENLHALTYSEIVRQSFDDPDAVLTEILSYKESFVRVKIVSDIMAKSYEISHKLALGLVERNQETYNEGVYMFVAANLVLERLQFMPSFLVTFGIGNMDMFVPIAQAVQKICADELEIHVEAGKAVLDIELQTDFGFQAFHACKPKVQQLINDVIRAEIENLKYIWSHGCDLKDVTLDKAIQYVLWSAKELFQIFGVESDFELPTINPVPFINKWIRIDAVQPSPQENRGGAYLLGAIIIDHVGKNFFRKL